MQLQRESQNSNAFDSIYTFQDLDVPDAQRIRGLETLLGEQSIRPACSTCCNGPAQICVIAIGMVV